MVFGHANIARKPVAGNALGSPQMSEHNLKLGNQDLLLLLLG